MSSPTLKGTANAIRRILREWAEMESEPSETWTASPINPEEPYEWHFTMKGPTGSAFEKGIYHGRLVLPVTYPMEPPTLYFLTVNGRFEVNKQVCLTATNFHPEEWQPAWGIRSILEALHAFFPTPAEGAVHALDWSKEIREELATASQNFVCPICNRSNNLIMADALDPDRVPKKPLTRFDSVETLPVVEPEIPPLVTAEETGPTEVIAERVETQEERDKAERERREVRSQPLSSGRALMGMDQRKWFVSLPIFLLWLFYFLGLEILELTQSVRLRLGLFLHNRTRGLEALIALLVVLGLVWSSIEIGRLFQDVWRETMFLHHLPINRVDQQTTMGELGQTLTNAERYEDFTLSFLFA